MTKLLTTINDLHLGAKRTGGTTPTSAEALRRYLLDEFRDLINNVNTDLLINGDWLDAFWIDLRDLLQVYDITCNWLLKHPELRLYASRGNHDVAKDSTKTSSFDFLVSLLEGRFGAQVFPILAPTALPEHDAYVIPHLVNQETFDAALSTVPEVSYLYLHCNYDNEFAVHADHSLNLSEAQAKALPVKHTIIAHEHQAKTALDGKVVVVGNQFPSSIADCLNNATKHYLVGTDRVCWWEAARDFAEQDWRNLENGPRFVRVVGEASAQQASDVVAAIARFRAATDAFVVTNAVQIAGLSDGDQLSSSLEQITSFSVLEALLEILTPAEGATVKKLLEGSNA